MPRSWAFPFAAMRDFHPSIHLLPPLVLLSCVVASTAAPAAGGFGGTAEKPATLKQLAAGIADLPEGFGAGGGVAFTDPVTGDSVPAFRLSTSGALASIDARAAAPGSFLWRSGSPGSQGAYRLIAPLILRWAGTEDGGAPLLTWSAGTLFDNVVNGFSGNPVPFRIRSNNSESSGDPLTIAAVPTASLPGTDSFRFSEPPLEGDGGTEGGGAPGGDQNGGDGTPATSSAPGPLPLLGVGVAFRFSRRLRGRIQRRTGSTAPTPR